MFDYLILNGQVIDGTGSPAYRADVGIANGRIAAIGDLKTAPARTVIDATGKYVTPGFIDLHRHADAAVDHDRERQLRSVRDAVPQYISKRDSGLSDADHGCAAGG